MSTATAHVEELTCSVAAYFSDSLNSLSHSEAKVFKESPALYCGRFLRGEWPQEEKTAFDVGTVFHDLVLGNQYIVTWETFAKLRTVAIWKACPEPDRPADYKSTQSGSRYWKCEDGAIRQSDHWGVVGNSYWALRGHGLTGFCKYAHHLASENFVPIPPDVLASNGAKNGGKWKEFAAQHEGRILLKEKEFEPLAEMVQSVKSHDKARKYLFDWSGKNERKLRWIDPETGIVRRAMLDGLRLRGEGDAEYSIIADLKTMQAMPTAQAFSKIAFNLGYYTQAAWYQDAAEALTGERPPFVFICVGKKPPYACETFELSEKYLAMAREANRKNLEKFKIARDTNVWESDTANTVIEVDPPNWAEYTPWEFAE